MGPIPGGDPARTGSVRGGEFEVHQCDALPGFPADTLLHIRPVGRGRDQIPGLPALRPLAFPPFHSRIGAGEFQ